MRLKALLLLSLLLPLVSAGEADFYVVNVAPKQLVPGETGELDITIKNLGTDYAAYLKAELDPGDVSSVDAIGAVRTYISVRTEAGIASAEYFGIVQQQQEIILRYPIYVKKNATTGISSVPLKLGWQDSVGTKEKTLYVGIKIEGVPKLSLAGVNTSPSRIYPDSEFTLTTKIENIGTGDAKAVELQLSLPKEISGESSAFLGTISKDSSATASFDLKTAKAAEPNSYKVAMQIGYIDDSGRKQTVAKDFDLFVSERGEIKLEIAGVTTSPAKLYPGLDFTLSVQIENIGKQDAKSVKVQLAALPEFVGEKTSFIGSLKQDDTSTAIFDLSVDRNAEPKSYDVAMKVYYIDDRGVEHAEDKLFSLVVAEAPRRFSYAWAAVILIVIAGAAYAFRRKAG